MRAPLAIFALLVVPSAAIVIAAESSQKSAPSAATSADTAKKSTRKQLTLEELKAELAAERGHLAELRKRYLDQYPRVVQQRAKIADIEEAIKAAEAKKEKVQPDSARSKP